MNRFLKIGVLVVLFVIFAILVGLILPVPAVYSDFMTLYHAVLGWSKGASIYDYNVQYKLMGETKPDHTIPLFPYLPYPPWYTGTFFFLAFLTYEHAYRTWFVLNFGVVAGSAQLLLPEKRPVARLLFIILFLLFFPVYGILVVGNNTLMVLLAGALFIYSVNQRDAAFAGAGLVLMTFKPHIGLFMALAGIVYLLVQKSDFPRQVLKSTVVAVIIAMAFGFLVEPKWIVTFPQFVLSFQSASVIDVCDFCASLPNLITGAIPNQTGPAPSALVGLVFFMITGILIWVRREIIFSSVDLAVSVGALLTAIVSPYMVNYDYVILLIPIAVLFKRLLQKQAKIFLILVLFAPSLSIVMGRAVGHLILILIDLLLFFTFLFFDISGSKLEPALGAMPD